MREVGEDPSRDRRSEYGFTVGDGADCPHHLFLVRVLEDVPEGAGPQRGEDGVIVFE